MNTAMRVASWQCALSRCMAAMDISSGFLGLLLQQRGMLGPAAFCHSVNTDVAAS